jgi:hypothetical protein
MNFVPVMLTLPPAEGSRLGDTDDGAGSQTPIAEATPMAMVSPQFPWSPHPDVPEAKRIRACDTTLLLEANARVERDAGLFPSK